MSARSTIPSSRQWQIQERLAGPGWYLGWILASMFIGALAGVAVSDLFPRGSEGPILSGIAVGAVIFALTSATTAIGGRIVVGVAELLTPMDGTPRDDRG